MEKEKNRPKTYKTIAIRITALVLSIWLIFMFCLTWAVAKDFQQQIETKAHELTALSNHIRFSSHLDPEIPGYASLLRCMRLSDFYYYLSADQLFPFVLPQVPDSYGSDDWFYGKWDLLYGFHPAVIFYDADQNVLMQSGNVLTFTYCTEASWQAQNLLAEGYSWIDIDALPQGRERMMGYLWGGVQADMPSSFYLWGGGVLRFTGYFEGERFVPTSVDYGYPSNLHTELTTQLLAKIDAATGLNWENIVSDDAPEHQELVTLYSWEVGGYSYEHQALTANGSRYNSLVDYLETAMDDERWYNYRRENLFDSIMIFTGKIEDDPEVGTYALAIRCWPVQYAVWRMIPTYLVSFGLVAAALWLILRSIRRNVANTLDMLLHRLTTDAPIEHLSRWKEPHALESILKGEQAQRRSLVNDNQQLRASLEFAKNAQENRRQLVSNITHELKTPLAIIHSYAEALQSGIAEEKKEKYLATILEEAERMDAMVLEMLDHSRLESGKVKLSADHFSLLKLTEGIAEKLAPALEERQLRLSWGFHNDCFLTADEARMGQVVTNLLTNAVRYTPDGGTIWLRVFSDEKDATFQIENEAEHLPKEVLEKIFETFYRAEDSRTGKGTGLGLPIARSIVELHRGRLVARNTWVNGEKCIQFSFTIPLK